MDALFTRADRELAIEDFGRNRVQEGVLRLFLKRGRRLGILTDDAVDELLSDLMADAQLAERIKAANRELRANGQVSA
jgi:hypothetical protein